MLIKTEVKRRTQSINKYILLLKSKVFNQRFKEAIEFLKHSKQSINNSYMAPYNPNAYLLDSLKTKNQKLKKQKHLVQELVLQKIEQINQIKIKRGFTRQNLVQKPQNNSNYQFIIKMSTEYVSIYVSRIALSLQDVQKIDYQSVYLQTDYNILRIIIEDYVTIIPFHCVLSIQSEDSFILLRWNIEKSNINYMILKFQDEEQRKLWTRCFNFSKLISQSQFKDKHFHKQNKININFVDRPQNRSPQQTYKQSQQKKSSSYMNKYFNLNINTNKTAAFDRLRRKSQYYPGVAQNNSSFMNWSKLRKVSEDLNMKQGFMRSLNNPNNTQDKKLNNQKSQKSLDEEGSQAVSVKGRKQSFRKQPYQSKLGEVSEFSKMDRVKEQRSQYQIKNKSQNSQSNKQIFFNQSSIHWIQQQNQQIKSKSSNNRIIKKNIFVNQTAANQQNLNESVNQHISQVPPQVQQSPLLPYNLRGKRRSPNDTQSKFQVRIKKISKTSQQKNTVKSSQNSSTKNRVYEKSLSSKSKSRQMLMQNQTFLDQGEQSDKNKAQIQSINQQYDDQQSQSKSKKINKSNLSIEDKSQDIVSEKSNSQTQSRKYGLDDLKYGVFLLKCSPNSWNPHRKKLHLSNNDEQLCYKNERGDDLKKINLSDIQKIEYNRITPGITKHIKNIEKRRCLAIKYKLKNEYKMLQFYLPQQTIIQDLQNFYQKLNTYVKYKNSQLD